MSEKRDIARVAGKYMPVEERGDDAVRRPDPIAVERLSPDVEEVAECVDPLDGRFGMDDPVGRVSVQMWKRTASPAWQLMPSMRCPSSSGRTGASAAAAGIGTPSGPIGPVVAGRTRPICDSGASGSLSTPLLPAWAHASTPVAANAAMPVTRPRAPQRPGRLTAASSRDNRSRERPGAPSRRWGSGSAPGSAAGRCPTL